MIWPDTANAPGPGDGTTPSNGGMGGFSGALGMLNEPYDYCITAKEVYDDPWSGWSYAGFVPGVPSAAGKALKKTFGKCDNAVEVVIDGSKHPEAARHAQDAIDAGVDNTGVVDRAGSKPRRKDHLAGEPVVPGKDRDEFPPAVVDNGGGGSSVQPVSPGDNRGAGASIGNQLGRVPDGTPVIVVQINVPPR